MKPKANIIAIIEARMTSSRLPGKHMLTVHGIPIIMYLIQRLKNSIHINDIVVAITKNSSDDVLEKYFKANNINFYRGSENNVMLRVIEAAKTFSADIICEVTGDCPLIDYRLVDELITKFVDSDVEYACNGITGLPDGMGSQVFTFDAIKKSYDLTNDRLDREHVTLHIRNNPNIFSVISLPTKPNLIWPQLGLTLDEKEDFVLIKKIIHNFKSRIQNVSCEEIINYLKENRELIKINSNVKRKGAT